MFHPATVFNIPRQNTRTSDTAIRPLKQWSMSLPACRGRPYATFLSLSAAALVSDFSVVVPALTMARVV